MLTGWKIIKLGDIIKHRKGFPFKSSDYQKFGRPIVRVSDFTNDSVDLEKSHYMDESRVSEFQSVELQTNDIVISTVGSGLHHRQSMVGNTIQIPPEANGALLNQNAVILRAKEGIDQEFLCHRLRMKNFQMDLVSKSQGSANQASITLKTIFDYQLLLPPKPQQEKIASILNSIHQKTRLLQTANQVLENIIQSIFKSWFIDFDRQTDYIDSESGEIPKGWKFSTIGKETNNFDSKRIPLSSRERLNRKGSFSYYGATEIIDYIDDYIFDGNYVLIAEDGSVINKDGKPYVQYVSGKFWANNHVHVLKGKNHISTEFLYLFFKQLNILSWITGAVQLKINQTNLNSIPIILPDKEILKKFQELAIPLFRNKIINELAINNLVKTHDYFLPKLMSGEIQV